MLFSVLKRKGEVTKQNFHPPRSQSRLRDGRSQLTALSGSDSHNLPSCHPWRSQAPHPTVSQSPQAAQMRRISFTDCNPHRQPLLLGHRDRDGDRSTFASRLGPQLVEALVRALKPCRTESPVYSPGPSSSSTGPRLGKLERLQKAWICLLPHSPPDDRHTTDPWLNHFPVVPHWQLPVGRAHCSADQLLSRTAKDCSLIVGCLWKGPTEAPSNGWARPIA